MKGQTNRLIYTFLCLLFFCNIKGQTHITFQASIPIPDHPAYHDDREAALNDHDHDDNAAYQPLVLPIVVSGLQDSINGNFGLEHITLSIHHNRISDLKVELFSPDGTVVWLTNRNGKNGHDYPETRFSQRGFRGPISSAETPFDGDYQPDGNLANVNNGQNPNGIWLLKIHDLAIDTEGVFEKIILTFSNTPAHLKASPCSVENPSGCYSSRSDGRLLPDLVVSANGTGANIWEIGYDEAKGFGLLMFEVRAMNLGEGPLELVGTKTWLCGQDTVENGRVLCKKGDITHDSVYPRQIFKQNIFQLKDGKLQKTERFAGTMAFDGHPGHDHFHADYYARFTFFKPDEQQPEDTSRWKEVGRTRKASFCLWDMQFCDAENGKCDYENQIYSQQNLPNYGFGSYKSCNDEHRQGISVGGIDWYGLHYDGQNLHLPKGTTNGLYFLKIEIDPFNFYEEASETNNTLILPVILRLQKPLETALKTETNDELTVKSNRQ